MSIKPTNLENLQKAFETELTNEIMNFFRESIFKEFLEDMWYVPNDPTKALFSSTSIQQIINSHNGQFMHPITRAIIPRRSFAKADKYLSIFFFLMSTVAENEQEGQGIKTIIAQDEDLQSVINNFSQKYEDDAVKKEIKAEIAKVKLSTETANEPWLKYIKELMLRFEKTYPTAFANIVSYNDEKEIQEAFEKELNDSIIISFKEVIVQDFMVGPIYYIPEDETKALFSRASIEGMQNSGNMKTHPLSRKPYRSFTNKFPGTNQAVFNRADRYVIIFFFLMSTVAENEQEGKGIRNIITKNEGLSEAIDELLATYSPDRIKQAIEQYKSLTETETANDHWKQYIKELILKFEAAYPKVFANRGSYKEKEILEENLQRYERIINFLSGIKDKFQENKENQTIFNEVKNEIDDLNAIIIKCRDEIKQTNFDPENSKEDIERFKNELIQKVTNIKQQLLITAFNDIQQKFENHLSDNMDNLINHQLLSEENKKHIHELKEGFSEEMHWLELIINNVKVEVDSDEYLPSVQTVSSNIKELELKITQIVSIIDKFKRAIDYKKTLITDLESIKQRSQDNSVYKKMDNLITHQFLSEGNKKRIRDLKEDFLGDMQRLELVVNNVKVEVDSDEYLPAVQTVSSNIKELERKLAQTVSIIDKFERAIDHKKNLITDLESIKQRSQDNSVYKKMDNLITHQLLSEENKQLIHDLKEDFLEDMELHDLFINIINNVMVEVDSDEYLSSVQKVSSNIKELEKKLAQTVDIIDKFERAIDDKQTLITKCKNIKQSLIKNSVPENTSKLINNNFLSEKNKQRIGQLITYIIETRELIKSQMEELQVEVDSDTYLASVKAVSLNIGSLQEKLTETVKAIKKSQKIIDDKNHLITEFESIKKRFDASVLEFATASNNTQTISEETKTLIEECKLELETSIKSVELQIFTNPGELTRGILNRLIKNLNAKLTNLESLLKQYISSCDNSNEIKEEPRKNKIVRLTGSIFPRSNTRANPTDVTKQHLPTDDVSITGTEDHSATYYSPGKMR